MGLGDNHSSLFGCLKLSINGYLAKCARHSFLPSILSYNPFQKYAILHSFKKQNVQVHVSSKLIITIKHALPNDNNIIYCNKLINKYFVIKNLSKEI